MLSLCSGLLTIMGLSTLSPDAGWFFKAIMALTGIVITYGIALFWQYAFSIVPDLSKGQFRWRGWANVLAGVLIILSLSSYWNVVTFTKNEITRLGGTSIVALAEQRFAEATKIVNGFLTYVGDISSFEDNVRALEKAEEQGGSTGIPEAGPVSRTYGQVADKLGSMSTSVDTAKAELQRLQSRASTCLADLSGAMTGGNKRKASEAVSCINQALSQMAGLDVASSLERSLKGLTSGIVVPANIRTEKQKQAIRIMLSESKIRADELAQQIASRERLSLPEPLTLEQPNILKGVLLYWQSLIPPIATALAIDILPLIILVFTVIRYDDQRQRGEPKMVLTIEELMDALEQANRLNRLIEGPAVKPDLPNYIDLEPREKRSIDYEPEPTSVNESDDDQSDRDDTGEKS